MYRIPENFIFILVPWVGLALLLINGCILVTLFLKGVRTKDPFFQGLRQIERWTHLFIILFSVYGVFVYANGTLDTSSPLEETSEVLEISEQRVKIHRDYYLSWASVRSWVDSDQTVRLPLWPSEEGKLWPGQPVLMKVRRGFFDVPWVLSIAWDEEKKYQAILKAIPTAAGTWKNLVHYYLDRKNWRQARLTAQEYLYVYPNDVEFASSIAAVLGQAFLYRESIALLEPIVARHPDATSLVLLGSAYSRTGRQAEGVKLIKAAIPYDPDNVWTYYDLAFAYKRMGRVKEAVENFEQVLKRRPNFPEIEQQIKLLRKTTPAQSSKPN